MILCLIYLVVHLQSLRPREMVDEEDTSAKKVVRESLLTEPRGAHLGRTVIQIWRIYWVLFVPSLQRPIHWILRPHASCTGCLWWQFSVNLNSFSHPIAIGRWINFCYQFLLPCKFILHQESSFLVTVDLWPTPDYFTKFFSWHYFQIHPFKISNRGTRRLGGIVPLLLSLNSIAHSRIPTSLEIFFSEKNLMQPDTTCL